MKKIVFNVTTQIKNFIQTYNNQLKNAYKNISDEDTETTYLVLLYEDLKTNLKDPDKFIDDYIALAEEWNLPYTFFPYYGPFNKAMIKCTAGLPHPIFDLTLEKKDNKVISISHQIAPGCLVLNLNKLKSIDFKFDANFPTVFYLQDLVEKCYRAELWISNCWYIDRFESWKDLKENNMKTKFNINNKNFADEQKKYFETYKDCKYKDAMPFIEDFKKWLDGEKIPVEVQLPQVKVQNSNVSITIPNELAEKKPEQTIEVKTQTTAPSSEPIAVDEKKLAETFANSEKVQEIAKLAQMIDEDMKKDI